MNALTITPEQFIFASENILKTTSLKIAERFDKDHSNVLKAIDKILTQVSDSFGKVNFNATEYEQENNLGLMSKHRSYDLTRDGFMIVVMSFTGKPAMAIKEWYINAFNAMAIQLSTNPLQLPEAKTKKALVGGLSLDQQDTIKALVKSRAEGLPKDKQAGAIIKQWSAIKKKYGMSYKEVAPENFVNIISLITRLPIEGELVEKSPIPTDTIAVSLNGATRSMTIIFNGKNDNPTQDYLVLVKVAQDLVQIRELNDNEQVKSQEQFMTALLEDDYIVMKKAELLGRLQA